MHFGCKDALSKNFKFEKCQYYVKFTSDRRIKYEIAHGCNLTMQLKRVFISNTDYDKFIIIRGCLLKKGKKDIIYEREYLLVLVKNESDYKLLNEIMGIILSMGITVQDQETFWISNRTNEHKYCVCKKYTCIVPKGVCIPMEIFYKTSFWESYNCYVLIFFLSLFLIIIIIIILVVHKVWIGMKANKVAPLQQRRT